MMPQLDKTTLLKIQESLRQGLTQSELSLRANCPRKWFFRYVQLYKRQGSFSWSLLFGDAMHTMLDEYYTILSTIKKPQEYLAESPVEVPEFRFDEDVILLPSQQEEYEYYQGLATVLFRRHNHYHTVADQKMVIVSTEDEAEIEYRGFRLRGKIDIVMRPTKRDGVFIMDHKTTYDINRSLLLGWNFRFQFLFYAWMYWKMTKEVPAGMYVNAIKKPAERRSVAKSESIPAFLKRIEQNIITNPVHYFLRERLPIDRGALQRFQDNTLDPVLTQVGLIRQGVNNRLEETKVTGIELATIYSLIMAGNTDYCQIYNTPCEFLPLCENNFQDYASEYIITNNKHPELTSK
jgi:hypothetical protein